MPILNKEQQEASDFYCGNCAVIAVPGAGKTLTMTHRIVNLINKYGVDPTKILGLTFTRNAAHEMRERLAQVLEEQSEQVTLSTIHGFCHYLLKRQSRKYEILSGKDQIHFVRNIMKRHRIKDISVGQILGEIGLAKNNLIDIEQFRDLFDTDPKMQQIAKVYESYEEEKSLKLLLDFDDLLFETFRMLSDNQEVREEVMERYTHLLVDEFQDTNPAQLEILKLMLNASNSSSFWIAGDDSQSIYSFTGASVANILNFEKTFPGSKRYILNLNYRSTPQILKACQNLIAHNKRKIDKTLLTENPNGEEVIVLESSSEEGEALDLVREISDLVERKGLSFKDIAVLYRANFQSLKVEIAFSEYKIPYRIDGGLGFFHRPEVKILLDYLELIIEPETDAGDESLLKVINVPNRYIGKKFTKELEDFAHTKDAHLFPALKIMPIELSYLRKNVKEFIGFIDPLMDESETLSPAETIHLLRNTLDLDRYVTDDDIPSPDDTKIANLDQLQITAAKFEDIRSFLAYVDTFERDSVQDKDEDSVSLMTIHKAKGLEFPVVFLIGLVEGILPTKKSGDIEEERRICFVAISRAMRLLFLSHSKTYLGQPAVKSIFLDEILGIKQP